MKKLTTNILFAVHEHKEIRGTENLTSMLGIDIRHKSRVFAEALALNRLGMIEMIISRGGRGKRTIYRDCGVIKINTPSI